MVPQQGMLSAGYKGQGWMDVERPRVDDRAEQARRREAERAEKEREREARKVEAQKEKERKAEEKRREREDKKKGGSTGRGAERGARGVKVAGPAGPPDDEEVELEGLVAAQREAAGYPPLSPEQLSCMAQLAAATLENDADAAASASATLAALPDRSLGPDLLMVTAFLHSFAQLVGLRPVPTVDQLAQALHDGDESPLLAAVHIGLLRLMQADMDEAHASGAAQSGAGGPGLMFDRGLVMAAHLVDEAAAWGYDVDVWRAHTNMLTWPEVLRELAVTATIGSGGRKAGQRTRTHVGGKPKLGDAGEDVEELPGGNIRLSLPARLGIGSVKAAAWQVLAEVGPEGLGIATIARRIQEGGLRDLTTSRTPEASVAGALSRDGVFTRVAPATFALSSVIQHHQKLLLQASAAASATPGNGPTPATPCHGAPPAATPGTGAEAGAGRTSGAAGEGTQGPGGEEEEAGGYSGEEEEEEEEGGGQETGPAAHEFSRESWVGALAAGDYGQLGLRERLDALVWLIHLVCDGPSVRNLLDARVEEVANVKKQLLDDSKTEKKRRQQEAQAQASVAAEAATRRLQELQAQAEAAAAVGGEEVPEGGMSLTAQMLAAADEVAAAQQKVKAAALAEDTVEEERAAKARRAAIVLKAEEANTIRLEPLGQDRRHNQYWHVTPSAVLGPQLAAEAVCLPPPYHRQAQAGQQGQEQQQDQGQSQQTQGQGEEQKVDSHAGRVLVESPSGESWLLLGKVQQLDGLAACLDARGVREGALATALVQHRPAILPGMPSRPISCQPCVPAPCSSLTQDDLHQPSVLLSQAQLANTKCLLQRLHELRPQASSFAPASASLLPQHLEPESCCWPPCPTQPHPYSSGSQQHQGQGAGGSSSPMALSRPARRLRVLKLRQDLLQMAAALVTPGALLADFDRAAWQLAVQAADTAVALRRCLGQLEAAIAPGYFTASFQRIPPAHKAAWSSPQRQVAEAAEAAETAAAEACTSAAAAALNAASRGGTPGPDQGRHQGQGQGQPGAEHLMHRLPSDAAMMDLTPPLSSTQPADPPAATQGGSQVTGEGMEGVVGPVAGPSPSQDQGTPGPLVHTSTSPPAATIAVAEPLSWLPATFAAVALRLQALDAALHYQQLKRCGRDRLAGYRYVLRPAPLNASITAPSKDSVPGGAAANPASTARKGMARAPSLQPGSSQPVAVEPQPGSSEQGRTAPSCSPCRVGLGNSFVSSLEGGVALVYAAPFLPTGRLRPVLLLPALPHHIMPSPAREFQIDVAAYRAAVALAEAQGRLYPPAPAPVPVTPVLTGTGRPAGARAASAAAAMTTAARAGRAEAMAKVSAAVRSATARLTQAKGKRGKDEASKVRSNKARKTRQSVLAREWGRGRVSDGDGDDDGPDRDYGEGYDDGFDSLLGQDDDRAYTPAPYVNHGRISATGMGAMDDDDGWR
ncbi:hypothetical protein V8C86DRAFT_1026806 [Haematococcus lacustris]